MTSFVGGRRKFDGLLLSRMRTLGGIEGKDRGEGELVDEKEESLGWISRGGGDGWIDDGLGWVLAAYATGENKRRMPFENGHQEV